MSSVRVVIIGLEVANGQLFCKCGHEVDYRAFVRRPDGSAFVTCPECHSLLADLAADVATLDPDEDACPF